MRALASLLASRGAAGSAPRLAARACPAAAAGGVAFKCLRHHPGQRRHVAARHPAAAFHSHRARRPLQPACSLHTLRACLEIRLSVVSFMPHQLPTSALAPSRPPPAPARLAAPRSSQLTTLLFPAAAPGRSRLCPRHLSKPCAAACEQQPLRGWPPRSPLRCVPSVLLAPAVSTPPADRPDFRSSASADRCVFVPCLSTGPATGALLTPPTQTAPLACSLRRMGSVD